MRPIAGKKTTTVVRTKRGSRCRSGRTGNSGMAQLRMQKFDPRVRLAYRKYKHERQSDPSNWRTNLYISLCKRVPPLEGNEEWPLFSCLSHSYLPFPLLKALPLIMCGLVSRFAPCALVNTTDVSVCLCHPLDSELPPSSLARALVIMPSSLKW